MFQGFEKEVRSPQNDMHSTSNTIKSKGIFFCKYSSHDKSKVSSVKLVGDGEGRG